MKLQWPTWWRQSLKLLQHEFRRGELTIIFLSVVLAVASVFALSGFTHSIKQALTFNSNSFIAADRVLQSARPLAEELLERAEQSGLQTASQILTQSMVFAGEQMQLVQLQAVSASYPLRGELLVKFEANGIANSVQQPKAKEVWLQQKLFTALQVSFGDQIDIGASTFTVTGLISQIPDASFKIFNAAPVMLLNIDDIASTNLVQPASRVAYKYLFAGNNKQISAFEQWIKPQLNDTQYWDDIKSRQSPLANALLKAEKYLNLASMLGIVLAAVAVAVASRRYGQRHLNTVAVFKALGASTSHMRKLYLLHWSSLSLVSISVGLLCGYLLWSFGMSAMSDYLGATPDISLLYPLLIAVLTGIVCTVTFAYAPIAELIATSPLLVIRGQAQSQSWRSVIQWLPPLLGLLTLLYVFSQSVILSLLLLGCSILVIIVLMLMAKAMMQLGRTVGSNAGQAFLLAVANIKRRANENSVQLISFTLAIQLLLLLMVVRNELLNEWQTQLPQFTANRFLINVSSTELEQVRAFIDANQLPSSDLYPVVLGRLTAVNGALLQNPEQAMAEDDNTAQSATNVDTAQENDQSRPSEQQRIGIGRELNLTWLAQLPEHNELVSGTAWQADDVAQVSVEQGLATRLSIQVGDKLTFRLGADNFTVPVTSIRQVNWQSMKPNFFMIFNPAVLQAFPATYIASMYVESSQENALQQFLALHPTIVLLDLDAMINQLRTVISQVSIAIQFILILVILAGSLVLIAQVQSTMEQRERELAILRTLGAKGRTLKLSLWYEFLLQGAIAGLLASITMELAVYVIQTQIFDMQPSVHVKFWLLGIVSGAMFVGLIGYISCWRLLQLSSVTLIRRTM
jgi:putative ABC transport system permease protein